MYSLVVCLTYDSVLLNLHIKEIFNADGWHSLEFQPTFLSVPVC